MSWIFNKEKVEDISFFPKNCYGFVYQITLSIDKETYYYIGRKNLYSKTKKNLGKKELALLTDKRLKKYKTIIKESDWKNYFGSNKKLKELINKQGVSKLNLHREILELCYSELELKYMEAKYIICSGAMENKYYFNDNISIKQIGKIIFNN